MYLFCKEDLVRPGKNADKLLYIGQKKITFLSKKGSLQPQNHSLPVDIPDQSCNSNRPEEQQAELVEPGMCVTYYLKLAMPISPQLGWAPLF